MYVAFNVSKWYLLFQNETLLNSTQAKLLRRVLKMAAYNDSSCIVVLINVKYSLKMLQGQRNEIVFNIIKMSTFYPSQKATEPIQCLFPLTCIDLD